MIRLVIALAFIFISTFTFAQTNGSKRSEHKDSTTLTVGYRFNSYTSSMDDFQSVLETNDFAKLEESAYNFEVFFKTRRANSRWDQNTAIGYYQRRSNNTLAENQVSLSGFTLSLERGYNVVNGKHFFLRPYYGIGLEYYKISFAENIGFGSLGNISNSNFKNYNATSFQVPLLLGLEIGTSFQIKSAHIDLSLHGGYKYHLDYEWKLDDAFTFREKIDLSSPFFGISMGLSLIHK